MSIERRLSDVVFAEVSAADRRTLLQHEEEERAALRQQELASQSAPQNAPEERIRIWEKLHGVDLPRAANHKLVGLIASHTALTVQRVQEEQQRRATPPIAISPAA